MISVSLRFFIAASGHASLEKFDSDVARICQSFDTPQLQAEDNGGEEIGGA
jgi:hypothetical protein